MHAESRLASKVAWPALVGVDAPGHRSRHDHMPEAGLLQLTGSAGE